MIFDSLAETLQPDSSARDDAGRIHIARRAERFLRKNQEDLLAAQSLIRFLGVPARTLRQGFREAFGPPGHTSTRSGRTLYSKNRPVRTPEGAPGLNYLCRPKAFYGHIQWDMAEILRQVRESHGIEHRSHSRRKGDA